MAKKMESGRRLAPPAFPPPSCPRCTSEHTKFCYYNNYHVSQPRYYCKDCRRYWTHGGAIRNIPAGGSSRKRGRADSASSSSNVWKPQSSGLLLPPSTTWGLGDHNPAGGGFGIGDGTFKPPITQTMLSFNGGGSSIQTPFRFNQGGGESGGVNTAAFGEARSNQNHLYNPLDDFGFPFLQRPQHHYPPPPPPSVWTTGQNMALNRTTTTLSAPMTRDNAATTNVVGMNQWCELNEMDYDYPLQTYMPPLP